MLQISPVETRQEFMEFISFAWEVYKAAVDFYDERDV
jgi:hypothetical protein